MQPEANRPRTHRASPGGQVVPLPSQDLLPYLIGLCGSAHRRLLVAVFIIDPRPEEDASGTVRLVLDALVRARWRGVDVRVLVGGSSRTPAIELAGRVARGYLQSRGVPCRQFVGRRGETSLHSKYVVADDAVVVGSHNWTRRALVSDDELSLAVTSPPLAAALRVVFERDWGRAGGASDGAPVATAAPRRVAAGGLTAAAPQSQLAESVERALTAWASTWHPALSFGEEERAILGRRLFRLAVQVAGEPLDEELVTDEAGVAEWAVQAAKDGLHRHLRRLAGSLGEPREAPARWVDEAPGTAVAPDQFVTLGRWEPRVNLTEASADELAALPALGPALADRIVAFRETGCLRDADDLLDVSGLGPTKLAALRPLTWVSPPGAPAVLSTPALDAFRQRPEMAKYVDLLREVGEPSVAAAVLTEVARAAAAAGTEPPPGGGGRPVTTEEAARMGRLVGRARELAASPVAASSAGWVGLVQGSAYLDLALRLVGAAKMEIAVVMFHMTYRPGQDHPSNALVESLVAARQRGVRVRVTLDLDRPGDVFGSRLVNEAAFEYLRAAGVEVAWDRPERLTHTKLLIVDGRDVLAGSHNWTAGSLYAYDDKSLVVRSEALAEALAGMVGPG
jgi:phosphatidylserine/phosphatidylglycerophosphate/cardiolipin synthase-like enzyme